MSIGFRDWNALLRFLTLLSALLVCSAVGCSSSNARPKPKPTPPRKAPSAVSPAPAASKAPAAKPARKVAKSLDDVTKAIVKLETPLPGGSVAGSGFLIDDRGWVATTYHVAKMLSTASRAKFAWGDSAELAGIVASAPDRDLAIVKLKTVPPQATLLDIAGRDRPQLGAKVYTYGHPLNNDFVLCNGIVSRLATTAELSAAGRGNIPPEIKGPADALWIETDAKMLPGNSGGPLLDEKCRVIGVNTFINPKAAIGYASHVVYLKDLADKSRDVQEPLPPPAAMPPATGAGLKPGKVPGPQIVISTEKMQQLFAIAAAFNWKPTKPDHYRVLKNLALLLTLCKAQHDSRSLAAFADGLFAKIKEVQWNDDRVKAVNLYAASEMGNAGQGAVFAGTVIGHGRDPGGKNVAIAFQIPGLSDLLLVPVGEETRLAQGSRVLVWGMILPKTGTGQTPGKADPQTVRIIQSHYLLAVPPAAPKRDYRNTVPPANRGAASK
jgi:S1-C subfamily serine protease